MADQERVVTPVNPRREADRKAAVRSRMASTGGMRLKLQVFGEIPSYHLFWENDEDAAIEQRLFEGFEFVETSEVKMQAWTVPDSDIAGKVSKYVGKKADGSPLRAFLLKCADDLWDERQASSQEQANVWDEAIRSGTVGGVDSRYKPKGAETSVKTR
jgi:hypothetical protein